MLDKAIEKVHDSNCDRVYVIDGIESSGKSLLGLQLCSYVDPSFSVSRIAFNAKQFEHIIFSVPKYSAVLFDEAFNGLSSRGAMSKDNIRLLRILQTCRQRNLFIFLTLPSFFLLDKYAGIFRSRGLFHVGISKKNHKVRFYKIYNYNDKLKLYINGKETYDYSKPLNPYCYRFYGKYPSNISEDAYIKKKLDSFMAMREIEEEKFNKFKFERDLLLYFLVKEQKMSQREIEKWFKAHGSKMDHKSIGVCVKNVEKKGGLGT